MVDRDNSASAATVSSYLRCLAKPSKAASLSSPLSFSSATKTLGRGKIANPATFRDLLPPRRPQSHFGFPRKGVAARVTTAAIGPPLSRGAIVGWRSFRWQIDPDAGFDGKLGIGFGLRHDHRKAGRGNARTGIIDDPAADGRVAAGQQRVGDDLLQPPTARNGQKVRLTFCFRDFDQIVVAQARRFRQDGTGDAISSFLARRRITPRRRLGQWEQVGRSFRQERCGR